MRKYAVIGLGEFGYRVAVTLQEMGIEVLAVDANPDVVESIKDHVSHAVTLDAKDEDALRAAGFEEVETAVVAIGEQPEVAILATALLRRLGVPRIVSRARSDLHGEILSLVGAHQIVRIEDQMGVRLGKSLAAERLGDYFTLPGGSTLAEVKLPPSFVGKTLRELDLRKRYNVNVVAIKRRVALVDDQGRGSFRDEVDDLPDPSRPLTTNVELVVVGPAKDVEELAREE